MAELPEVCVFADKLRQVLVGRTISSVMISNASELFGIASRDFREALTGQTVSSVAFRGKYTEIQFESGRRIFIHLALNGNMNILEEDPKVYDIAIIFESNLSLTIFDAQHLAKIYYCAKDEEFERYKRVGPSAISEDFNAQYLKLWIGGRNTPIKSLLLDQKIVSGIGNTYVDEILHEAGIDPSRRARLLSQQECDTVVMCAKMILSSAMDAAKGVSLRSSDLKFIEHMTHDAVVTTRKKLICPKCNSPFSKATIAGHFTYYCQNCQK